jgi:chemotaxis protein MotA
LITAILKNLVGYDFLIILLAAFNAFYVLPRLKSTSLSLKKKLRSTVYLPIKELTKLLSISTSEKVSIHEVQEIRDHEVKLYHLFETINSIFPLLGILGTIIALLKMVSLDSSELISNFTVALTSTFWGLVFAIIFRAIDGTLMSDFLNNKDQVELIYERIDHFLENNEE